MRVHSTTSTVNTKRLCYGALMNVFNIKRNKYSDVWLLMCVFFNLIQYTASAYLTSPLAYITFFF